MERRIYQEEWICEEVKDIMNIIAYLKKEIRILAEEYVKLSNLESFKQKIPVTEKILDNITSLIKFRTDLIRKIKEEFNPPKNDR